MINEPVFRYWKFSLIFIGILAGVFALSGCQSSRNQLRAVAQSKIESYRIDPSSVFLGFELLGFFDPTSNPSFSKLDRKNPLVKTIVCGAVRLLIFENHNRAGEIYYTVKVSRSYRDPEGTWQDTNSFYKSQLPQLMYACQRALQFLEEAESQAASDVPF